jgi:hypothetical protein
MAGRIQPELADALDHAWLTKQEIEGKLPAESWATVKDLLSDF